MAGTESSLLAEVIAHPEDDAPRLVYADWLEEHGAAEGQARAEFIRAQVEHARLPPEDPRRWELAERELTLVREHGPAWRAGLPAWTRSEPVWFRRGFPAEVVCTGRAFLRGGKGLRRRAPIDGVWLHTVDGVAADVFPHLEGLGGLRLVLSEVRTGENREAIALAAEPALAGVRRLHLYFGGVRSGRGLAELFDSPHLGPLDELHLTGQHAVDGGALRSLAGWRHRAGLRGLSLTEAGQRHGGPLDGLAPCLVSLAGLESLALQFVRGGAAALSYHLMTPSAQSLRSLAFLGYQVEGNVLDAVATSPYLGNLRSLWLQYERIGDEGAARLARNAALAGLCELNLHHNQIGPAGVEALVNSPHLAGLRTLRLSDNPLGLDGGRVLAPRVLARLRELDLRPGVGGKATVAPEVVERFGRRPYDQAWHSVRFDHGLCDPGWRDRRGVLVRPR